MKTLKALAFTTLGACGGAQKPHNFEAEVPRCKGQIFTITTNTLESTTENTFCSEPPDPINTCLAIRQTLGIDVSTHLNLAANCQLSAQAAEHAK